ncbi:hypothetical protein, partial [Escherichia coli]|uniref:hypothetical protein n=1 Tax=Escherichia coli TaxID=562 RepID=UPI001BC8680C
SSKFIHTWLRFGEIMRGSLSTLRRITGTTLAVTFSTFTEHNGTSLSDAFAVWDYQSGRYSFILNFTSLS